MITKVELTRESATHYTLTVLMDGVVITAKSFKSQTTLENASTYVLNDAVSKVINSLYKGFQRTSYDCKFI